MLGTVGVADLEVTCIIGDLPEEREREQSLNITIEYQYDVSAVAASDVLDDAVDYVAVVAACRDVAVSGRFRMIETLAVRIVDGILEDFPVSWVKIQIRKPEAILGAAATTVVIEKRKEEV